MKKISKVLLSGGLTVCMMAGLFASPTSLTTGGLFETEADNYLDTLKFSEVEFDNVFTNINISSSSLDAGAAWESGEMYMAAGYSGNLFSALIKDNTDVSTTQKEGTDLNAGSIGVIDKTITEKRSTSNSGDNRFSFLTNIGNMGIKATMGLALNKTKDNGTGGDISYEEKGDVNGQRTVTRQNNKTLNNSYSPSVEIGLPVNIGEHEVSMKAGLGMYFADNGSKENSTKTYTWYNNEMSRNPVSEVTSVTKNREYGFVPSFYAEAFDAYISYDGSFSFYNQNFKGADGKKIHAMYGSTNTKTYTETTEESGRTAKTKTDDLEYNASYFDQRNDFSIGYKKTKELNEKLSLGFNVLSYFEIYSSTDGSNYKGKYNTSVTEYNYDNAVDEAKTGNYVVKEVTTEESTAWGKEKYVRLVVYPGTSVAAQYAFTPNVKLNMGFSAYFGYVHSTSKTLLDSSASRTTKTFVTTYKDGTTTTEVSPPDVSSDTRTEKSESENSFSNISTSFSAGLSFLVTENVLLDCTINASKNGIQDITKLFQSITISGTVKF